MEPTNKSSGEKTADAIIVTGKAILAGVQLISDLSNDPTLVIYDNTSAAGVKIFESVIDVATDAFDKYYTMPGGGIRCDLGIYCDVTGTGASYIIHYR